MDYKRVSRRSGRSPWRVTTWNPFAGRLLLFLPPDLSGGEKKDRVMAAAEKILAIKFLPTSHYDPAYFNVMKNYLCGLQIG